MSISWEARYISYENSNLNWPSLILSSRKIKTKFFSKTAALNNMTNRSKDMTVPKLLGFSDAICTSAS